MGRLDLNPATGSRRRRIGARHARDGADTAEDQLTTLAFDGGELFVPHLDAAIGERVRATDPRARRFARVRQAGRRSASSTSSPRRSSRSRSYRARSWIVQLAVGGVDARRAHHARGRATARDSHRARSFTRCQGRVVRPSAASATCMTAGGAMKPERPISHSRFGTARPSSRIGPGKVALLEAIGETGSITSSAKKLGMSYRRAWLLVEETNRCLVRPAVADRDRRPATAAARRSRRSASSSCAVTARWSGRRPSR